MAFDEEDFMGFSGHLVFACSERPLQETALFGSADPGMKAEVHQWPPRPGGWQTLQMKQGIWEDDHLFALVDLTGAPVCVADVSDSSVALVTGLDTLGRRWQAWLNPDVAAALLVEQPEDVDDMSLWVTTPQFEEAVRHKHAELDAEVPADAEGALVWASAAGAQAATQQSRIEELLRAREPFVEDLFEAMLIELGFPEAAQSSPQP